MKFVLNVEDSNCDIIKTVVLTVTILNTAINRIEKASVISNSSTMPIQPFMKRATSSANILNTTGNSLNAIYDIKSFTKE